MQAADLPFLLSVDGRAWLAELTAAGLDEQTHLALAARLRAAVGPAHTHALLETALLRQKAAAKFSRAAEMLFDRAGLEMSSAEVVSAWRARRYAGLSPIADLACGLGGDAIGLAAHGAVIGVDREPLRLALAAHNLAVYGRAERFTPLQADLMTLPPFPAAALFCDPARRDARGRRLTSLHAYQPPLTALDPWRAVTQAWGVKVSPGVAYAELPAAAEVEFISVGGEVREGVLWWGDLRSGVSRRATVLPEEATLTADPAAPRAPVAPPRRYLFEPDGAIVRAHLVGELAAQCDLAQIDAEIAYLTGDRPLTTPLARCFAIVDWFPFQLKALRRYLRERSVGRATIKKRGSALDPDWLRGQLDLRGEREATLFLTRAQGRPIVIVAEPVVT